MGASRSCIVLSFLLAGACFASPVIGPLEPRPALTSGGDERSYRLVLGANVVDAFRAPGLGSARGAEIRGWRTTLARAFDYALGDRGSAPRDELIVERADLSFSPATLGTSNTAAAARLALGGSSERLGAILAHGTHAAPKTSSLPQAPSRAENVYAAVLRDAQGEVIGRASGRVRSAGAADDRPGRSRAVREAVELLFAEMVPALLEPLHARTEGRALRYSRRASRAFRKGDSSPAARPRPSL